MIIELYVNITGTPSYLSLAIVLNHPSVRIGFHHSHGTSPLLHFRATLLAGYIASYEVLLVGGQV